MRRPHGEPHKPWQAEAGSDPLAAGMSRGEVPRMRPSITIGGDVGGSERRAVRLDKGLRRQSAGSERPAHALTGEGLDIARGITDPQHEPMPAFNERCRAGERGRG
ncbi:MAG: hypothetical protein RLZZ21_2284, partial [Planctomycetota bacterium]